MKIVGLGLLLAGLLFAAVFWLLPFSPGNPYFHVQHCVPIREAMRHDYLAGDLCHFRSVDRVTDGAIGAAMLAVFGLTLLLAGWISTRADSRS